MESGWDIIYRLWVAMRFNHLSMIETHCNPPHSKWVAPVNGRQWITVGGLRPCLASSGVRKRPPCGSSAGARLRVVGLGVVIVPNSRETSVVMINRQAILVITMILAWLFGWGWLVALRWSSAAVGYSRQPALKLLWWRCYARRGVGDSPHPVCRCRL